VQGKKEDSENRQEKKNAQQLKFGKIESMFACVREYFSYITVVHHRTVLSVLSG